MRTLPLPLPPIYDAKNNSDFLYDNPLDKFISEAQKWTRTHSITNSGLDAKVVKILNIDNQRDFNHPEGGLFVGPGLPEAIRLSVEFFYKYLSIITEIVSTLDTHYPAQIFFPQFHMDQNNDFVPSNIVITEDDYQNGKYHCNPAIAKNIGMTPVQLNTQIKHYCHELEKNSKKNLYIWSHHCLLGTPGHTMVGVINEAIMFHQIVRNAANHFEIKGGSPFTEHYSIFAPEVMTLYDGTPIPGVGRNTRLIENLLSSDVIIIMGQAMSHCVLESINDLVNEVKAQDPNLLKKIYVLEDCMAPVVIPGVVDFTDPTNTAFNELRNEINIVKSTDPMETWPNIKLS